ncbi:MAG: hypothetical protein IPG13_06985 [Rhodocyclaceae bacterium]|nr:hypothetical protein [Rhodocyclaceae bacterium]MBK6553614.1 hypothetical protein [Rhodocyclaceae bacterium]
MQAAIEDDHVESQGWRHAKHEGRAIERGDFERRHGLAGQQIHDGLPGVVVSTLVEDNAQYLTSRSRAM